MNSVCMATYNGELFVKSQIFSILKQLNPDDELVISDDSSTDMTIARIKEISDSRIKLLENNLFRDPIRNFEHAISNAKGIYIFLSDQDDIWLDSKYKEMLLLLKDYSLIVSDSIIVDEDLNILYPSFFKYFNSGKGLIKNMIRSSYYGSCMAFHSELLRYALPFPDTKEIGHDLWLGLVAELTGKVYFANKQLILYRRHANAFTPESIGKSTRSGLQKLTGRLVMVREIVKVIYKIYFNGKRSRFNHHARI